MSDNNPTQHIRAHEQWTCPHCGYGMEDHHKEQCEELAGLRAALAESERKLKACVEAMFEAKAAEYEKGGAI